MTKLYFILLLLTLSIAHGADWPSWLGPNGDGTSPESNWKSEINDPNWKAKV